jgi:small conductance mechanosensitive channel
MQTPSISLPPSFLEATAALALAATLALALALIATSLARRALGAVTRDGLSEPLARGTLRIVRVTAFVVAFAVFAFPALDLAGVETQVGLESGDLGRWAAESGVRIAAILVLAFVIVRVLAGVITRAEREMAAGTGLDAIERRKRAQTLSRIVRSALSALIWTAAALIVLRELEVDITPVLTGAGVLGLAIGFGAQTLVRDVISGFFLIIEDQIRVGDVATVNNIGGLVEQINMRTIVLRDQEGTVHVIPNGEIRTLSNRTKDFSYYVIDLGVGFDEDTDRVVAAVKKAGDELAADPAYGPNILEPVEILGIDDFKESAVTVKFRIKTVPLKQWEIGRALRRRVKLALDAEGISIPLPKFEIHVRNAAEDSQTWTTTMPDRKGEAPRDTR